jgi:hypothetical protein
MGRSDALHGQVEHGRWRQLRTRSCAGGPSLPLRTRAVPSVVSAEHGRQRYHDVRCAGKARTICRPGTTRAAYAPIRQHPLARSAPIIKKEDVTMTVRRAPDRSSNRKVPGVSFRGHARARHGDEPSKRATIWRKLRAASRSVIASVRITTNHRFRPQLVPGVVQDSKTGPIGYT